MYRISRFLRVVTGCSHTYLTGRERVWLFSESLRRIVKLLFPTKPLGTVLLSYPRSGNHAVRKFLEDLSSRPTLSAIDRESYLVPRGLHDLPLFLRGAQGLPLARAPIAAKRHKFLRGDSFERLVYLERPVVDAVLSHLRDCSDPDFKSRLETEVLLWMTLKAIFNAWPADKRYQLSFQQVKSSDRQAFEGLANFLGLEESVNNRIRAIDGITSANALLARPSASDTYQVEYPERAEWVRTEVARQSTALLGLNLSSLIGESSGSS